MKRDPRAVELRRQIAERLGGIEREWECANQLLQRLAELDPSACRERYLGKSRALLTLARIDLIEWFCPFNATAEAWLRRQLEGLGQKDQR